MSPLSAENNYMVPAYVWAYGTLLGLNSSMCKTGEFLPKLNIEQVTSKLVFVCLFF